MYFYRIEKSESIDEIRRTGYYNKKIIHLPTYDGEQIYGMYFFKDIDVVRKYNLENDVIVRFNGELLCSFTIYNDTEYILENESFYVKTNSNDEITIIKHSDIEFIN